MSASDYSNLLKFGMIAHWSSLVVIKVETDRLTLGGLVLPPFLRQLKRAVVSCKDMLRLLSTNYAFLCSNVNLPNMFNSIVSFACICYVSVFGE